MGNITIELQTKDDTTPAVVAQLAFVPVNTTKNMSSPTLFPVNLSLNTFILIDNKDSI